MNVKAATRPRSFLLVIVAVGFFFHLTYLFTIVDIYFRTPIVHGMQPVAQREDLAPAKRLVLFVADGLRADKFFEQGHQIPFFREIIETRGAWGVSHTRVPTESRPGHVAMIAGLYEDVSAVTKGWKENPVEFDSVFNQSSTTFSWGSPDIVPMFSKDISHVHAEFYLPEFEDFASDAWQLDQWVFDKVNSFFDNASADASSELSQKLNQGGVVLFLHLLGTDTTGHAKRPYSREYISNIHKLDKEIGNIVNRIETYFNDSKTAYVFTSDHGMSDKGNHGDGEVANTETPLIVWGAGVRGPIPERKSIRRYSSDSVATPPAWGLNHLLRVDVEQADIAPLMSSLIGVPIPANNVGMLPARMLDTEEHVEFVLRSMHANAEQIFRQLEMKSESKKKSSVWFRDYPRIKEANTLRGNLARMMSTASSESFRSLYVDIEERCVKLQEMSIKGLSYFQTYDWPFLMTVVVLGYLGWVSFVVVSLVAEFSGKEAAAPTRTVSPVFAGFIGAIGALVGVVLYLDESPIQYYLYTAYPVGFWAHILGWHHTTVQQLVAAFNDKPNRREAIGTIANSILLLSLMVFGFFRREVYSLCFVGLAIWGFIQKAPSSYRFAWIGLCAAMSIFPILPAGGMGVPSLVVAGGAFASVSVWIMRQLLSKYFIQDSSPQLDEVERAEANSSNSYSMLRLVLYAGPLVSGIVGMVSEILLQSGYGLPFVNQAAAWIICALAVTQVVISERNTQEVLLTLFLALSSMYTLLSVSFVLVPHQVTTPSPDANMPFGYHLLSFEVLFFVIYWMLLILWMVLEQKVAEQLPKDRVGLSVRHIRIATFYVLFCFVAFFGTGNIASIGSFQLSSTYRFITVFSPFLMAFLLLVKLIIPFVLLAAVFGVLNRVIRSSDTALFLVAAVLAEFMTICFFFLVRDEGSWLDIGMSISHFAIMNAFLVFQLALVGISQYLLRHIEKPKLKKV